MAEGSNSNGDLSKLLDRLKEVVSEAEEGYVKALKDLHDIIVKYSATLKEHKDILDYVDDLAYALAYNALASGAPPAKVKELAPEKAWSKLEPLLPQLAAYRLVKAVEAGDTQGARMVYDEYRSYLPQRAAQALEVASDPAVVDAVYCLYSCNAKELTAKAPTIIKELRSLESSVGDQRLAEALKLYYKVDLGDVVNSLAWAAAAGILASNPGKPAKALEEMERLGLTEVPGLSRLVSSLKLYVDALGKAKAGDLAGAVRDLTGITDTGVLAGALQAVLSILYREHPDALAGAGANLESKLEALAEKAGLDIDVAGIIQAARAAGVARRLAEALKKGDYEGAKKIWDSVSGDERVLVATMLGVKPSELSDLIEKLAETDHALGLIRKVKDYMAKGDFDDAYKAWVEAPRKTSELAAKLAGTTYDKMRVYLATLAAIAEALSQQKPTLADLQKSLAKRLGEREAAKIISEIMSTNKYMPPLARFKILADSGKYEEAYKLLPEIPENERGKAAEYLIYIIIQDKGPASAAEFLARHGDAKKYLPEKLVDALEAYEEAGEAAKAGITAVEEAAAYKVAEKIHDALSNALMYLKTGDIDKAEEILVRNSKLLKGTPELSKVLDYFTLVDAWRQLDSLASEVDGLLKEASNLGKGADTSHIESKAGELLSVIDSWIDDLKSLESRGVKEASKYVEGFKKAKARVLLALALAKAASGDVKEASDLARDAVGLDNSLSGAASVIVELASDNPVDDVLCVLDTLGIHHGAASSHHQGGVPTPKPT